MYACVCFCPSPCAFVASVDADKNENTSTGPCFIFLFCLSSFVSSPLFMQVFLGIRIGIGLILGGLAYLFSKTLLIEVESD